MTLPPRDELGHLLRPAGGGVHLVSTGRAAQLELQRKLYNVATDDEVRARFLAQLERIPHARGVILGIPSDVGAGFVRGANLGPQVIRQAIHCCRKGGTVSIPGVYGGLLDKLPFGAAFAKGLTLKMGQTHVHRYLAPLLTLVKEGRIDPSFVVTHRMPLERAAEAYETFKRDKDDCVKVVLRPQARAEPVAH